MPAAEFLDTLLLLALPASGKSEVRRYMLHIPEEERMGFFHIRDTVQLDDFPYVHFFHVVDDVLKRMGEEYRFYHGPRERTKDGRDWGTLLKLVNQDYRVMMDPGAQQPSSDPLELFQRIDTARAEVGAPPLFGAMSEELRAALAADDTIRTETERLIKELFGKKPANIHDYTLVIEFARGGPDGAEPPFDPPHGYQWNLSQLSPELLERLSILYIWVTPEESRRKNKEREDPNDPGSILNHSAPDAVMYNDYGACDMAWLLEQSDRPNTIRIEAHGKTWYLPVARFDNRLDKTSFVRDEPDTWDPQQRQALHEGLMDAMGRLWQAHTALRG